MSVNGAGPTGSRPPRALEPSQSGEKWNSHKVEKQSPQDSEIPRGLVRAAVKKLEEPKPTGIVAFFRNLAAKVKANRVKKESAKEAARHGFKEGSLSSAKIFEELTKAKQHLAGNFKKGTLLNGLEAVLRCDTKRIGQKLLFKEELVTISKEIQSLIEGKKLSADDLSYLQRIKGQVDKKIQEVPRREHVVEMLKKISDRKFDAQAIPLMLEVLTLDLQEVDRLLDKLEKSPGDERVQRAIHKINQYLSAVHEASPVFSMKGDAPFEKSKEALISQVTQSLRHMQSKWKNLEEGIQEQIAESYYLLTEAMAKIS